MSDEPKKIFDLMDIETEPTDEQLVELMEFMAVDVRARYAIGEANLKLHLKEALAEVRLRESAISEPISK